MSDLRRQQDELESLKSIYSDIFTDLTSSNKVWSRNASPHFQISLSSHENPDRPVVSLVLDIQFTPTYPSLSPLVTLSETHNLLRADIARASTKIESILREYRGEEVCFTLIMDMKELIDELQLTTEQVLSLEDERRKRIETERLQLEQREQEKRHREHLAKMKMSKEANEQIRQMSDNALDFDIVESPLNSGELVPPPNFSAQSFTFDNVLWGELPHSSARFQFRLVIGFVRYHSRDLLSGISDQYIVRPYVAPSTLKRLTAQILSLAYLLTVVELEDEYWQTHDARTDIRKLEAQLEVTLSLPASSALVKLYGFQIDQHAQRPRRWTICVLTGLPASQTIDSVLHTAGSVSWSLARTWLIQILPALELLHNAGLAHGLICTLSALVCDDGLQLGAKEMKFSHPSYGHTLLQMASQNDHVTASFMDKFIPKRWQDPDPATDPSKGDIWQLAVLFLRIMLGSSVLDVEFLSPLDFHNHFDPYQYPGMEEYAERVFDFLSKMLQQKSSKRISVLELNAVMFLRGDISGDQLRPNSVSSIDFSPTNVQAEKVYLLKQSANTFMPSRRVLAVPPTTGRRRASENQNVTSGAMLTNSFFQAPENASSNQSESRYKREFEEVGKLGKGAFGEVLKARNRMEGTFYAVKKIKHKQNKLETLLNEVLSLARLNHQYIVRYYGCWVEDVFETGGGEFASESEDESELSDDQFEIPVNIRSSSFLQSRDNSFQVDYLASSLASMSFGGQDYDDRIVFAKDSNSESNEELEKMEESSESESESIKEKSEKSLESEEINSAVKYGEEQGRTAIYNIRRYILYIQMEFCENNTLLDLIEKGLPANPHEYWRLFRQVLEAVSYIHSSGFIHRDLKPTNIFIDKSNNIKVGDFGLARSSQFFSAVSKDNQVAPRNKDLSTVVGTFFYTANEVASGDYDEKLDMYSLGIIFFEMCYKLGTGMERAMILNKLRLVDIQFPADFSSKRATEKKIITSLLNHNPKLRPGAAQLLSSGVIPVEHQDVIIREALRSLADPASPWQQQVRETLFNQPYSLARDIMFDRVGKDSHSGVLEHTSADYLILSTMLDAISCIFRCHGAVPDFNGSSLIPKSLMQAKELAYELLDRSGAVLTLNYDLVLPMARFLSREKMSVSKLYTHEFVYRPNLRGAGKPDKYSAMLFDIFSGHSSSLVADAAECIKAADEIVVHFPCFSAKNSETYILINHLDILHGVIDFAFGSTLQLSKSRRYELMGVLLQLVERGPEDIKSFLRTDFKVQHTVIRDLFDSFNFSVDPASGMQKLRKAMVDSPLLSRIEQCYHEIQQILLVAQKLGLHTQLTFNPLSNYNARYYDNGFMFQVIHRMEKNRKFSRVATGGRFDRLIDYLSNEGLTQARTTHGVGFQLNTTLMFLLMKNQRRSVPESRSNWKITRCDVLVYSLQDHIFNESGYELVGDLWAHKIAADWCSFTSHEDLLRKAAVDGCNWIVQLKQPTAQNKKARKSLFKPIRVKEIAASKDIDLEYSELVSHLLREIEIRNSEHTSPQTSGGGVGDNSNDENSQSQIGEHIFSVNIDQKVVVVPNSAPRGRKNNKKDKWELENDSKLAAADAIKTLAGATIMTVDLTDAVLDMILSTSLQVLQEEWLKRAFSTNNKLPKTFAISIHDALMKESLKGARWAILHSPRSDRTSIIDLQR